MQGLSNISLNLAPVSVGTDILLFSESSIVSSLRESWKYNISSYCQITSLNIRASLPSYPLSDIPNIYPEDGYYQRWAKKQQAINNGSFKITLFTKHPNGTTMNFGSVQVPNYGGVWTENILLEILQSPRESLGLGEGVELWCRPESPILANDKVYIFGLAKWSLDLIPIDPVLQLPQHFGVNVGVATPTLIVGSNSSRYRIHLQNVGENDAWFALGSGDQAVPNQCLFLPPGATWEEETLKYSTHQAIWAIATGGDTTIVGMEQSLVY